MPSYKLSYFNLTGRGEPIRLVLVYAGIPFEDHRIEFQEWPKYKGNYPLGQLPVLEIDGKEYTQMTPLCRYLASVTNLGGKTPLENLAIDTAVEMLWDLLKIGYERYWEIDADRKQVLLKKLDEQLKVLLGKLEEDTKKNEGFIALKRTTWADLVFLCSYEDLENLSEGKPFANSPNLVNLKKKLLENKNIREYLQKRPPNPFFKKYSLKEDL